MATFLFWNVNRKRLDDRVARMVAAHSVEVVVLAEYPFAPAELVERLTAAGAGGFRCVSPESPARNPIRVFVRDPGERWVPLVMAPRWQFYLIQPTRIVEQPLLLAAVHLPSKLYLDSSTQQLVTSQLVDELAEFERATNAPAVVVGDLNMNPFEEGVIGADALHAVPVRDKAREESRQINGRRYPMFFNPMWGLLGDHPDRPPGTYYLATSAAVCYFWNIFDQVLVRPPLIDRLDRVRILTTDGERPLVTARGLPDETAASDHLPLVFDLD